MGRWVSKWFHLYKIKARQQSDAVLGLVPAFQPLLGKRHHERPVVSPVAGRQGAVLNSRRNFGEIPTDSGFPPSPLTTDLHRPVSWAGSVSTWSVWFVPYSRHWNAFSGFQKSIPVENWHGNWNGLPKNCPTCELTSMLSPKSIIQTVLRGENGPTPPRVIQGCSPSYPPPLLLCSSRWPRWS